MFFSEFFASNERNTVLCECDNDCNIIIAIKRLISFFINLDINFYSVLVKFYKRTENQTLANSIIIV